MSRGFEYREKKTEHIIYSQLDMRFRITKVRSLRRSDRTWPQVGKVVRAEAGYRQQD